MTHRFIRAGIAALALIVVTAESAGAAVAWRGWFGSTAGDQNPLPQTECVKRAPAALASQGFTANQNGTNPVYFDATNAVGSITVILWCIQEPKGFDMVLIVMSDDPTRSVFDLGRSIFSSFWGKPPEAPSASDISGVWRLTSTCSQMVAGGWQTIVQLNQAASGALSGTTRSDPLNSTILAGQSKYSGNTMTLVLAPDGWSIPLQLTGQLNGIQIAGKVHHLGPDDCTFTMTRS